MRIKKGDTVKIISGKDRGKTGRVLRVDHSKATVTVEGFNVYKKHQRPKKQGGKGEIVNIIRPLKASKAMPVCSNCKEAVRVGYRAEGEQKVRYCKKCKSVF